MDAIEDDLDEIVLDGHVMSPRLHLTLHEVAANQLWHDDPPEMWTTAQRLTDAGHDRHTVVHMLGSVVSGDIYNAMTGTATFGRDRTRCELAALPGSWQTQGQPRPVNRAARRVQARRRPR